MSKGRMAKVVGERYGFGRVLVKAERAGYRS
jgi:hypothetical protein